MVSLLVAIALLVRWTHLFTSPPLPSVGHSVLTAMAVSEGRAWPLADQAPYLGAPFVYMLAGVYRLFGPSLEATMLLTWMLGALAIIPAYLLGRELAGPVAGAVAGILLATSPAHTVISSHVPWVHSLTPLLATISLWLLARSAVRREPRTQLLAGLLIGATLQTHPTALPLLLGASLAVGVFIRAWRRPLLAALFFGTIVLGYAPLLAHHLHTQFEVVADIDGKKSRYLDADTDPNERAERGVYLNNLEQLGSSLVRLSSGELQDEREEAAAYLFDPRLLIYPLLAVIGLVVAPRRLGLVLLAGLTCAVLLPPMFNGKYKPILDGRYLMPLIPVVFVGIGCLAAGIARSVRQQRLRPVVALALVVTTAGLSLGSLNRLDTFYEESTEDGASNRQYLQTRDRIRAAREPDEAVWLDPRLRTVKMPAGDTAGSTFAWLLPVSGVPLTNEEPDAYTALADGELLLVQRATASELDRHVKLEYVDGFGGNGKDAPSYRVVRASQ
jgi:4-amino-4-deoxy-L-arabinose transferase-like glycosyltransferase